MSRVDHPNHYNMGKYEVIDVIEDHDLNFNLGNVIKYADAVTKDVAIGASIVLSSLASVQLFGFEISEIFILGVALVIYAVFLYGERANCCGLLP